MNKVLKNNGHRVENKQNTKIKTEKKIELSLFAENVTIYWTENGRGTPISDSMVNKMWSRSLPSMENTLILVKIYETSSLSMPEPALQ